MYKGNRPFRVFEFFYCGITEDNKIQYNISEAFQGQITIVNYDIYLYIHSYIIRIYICNIDVIYIYIYIYIYIHVYMIVWNYVLG